MSKKQVWETFNSNYQWYVSFRAQIEKLAMSRFRWIGLPETCDERFLELTLLRQGMACLAWPDGLDWRNAFSLQAVIQSLPNAYGNYDRFMARGVNGKQFMAERNKNGVMVYDNRLRDTLMPYIEQYAREMADLMMCKRVNRAHAKTPFLMRGPRERKNDMLQIMKQIAGGETAVVADSSYDVQVDAIQTNVPFLGKELNEDLNNIWNMVYKLLGISANPYKKERQTADEIQKYSQATDVALLDALTARREACDEFNALTGASVGVVLNQDFESSSYNAVNDLSLMIGEDDDSVSQPVLAQ